MSEAFSLGPAPASRVHLRASRPALALSVLALLAFALQLVALARMNLPEVVRMVPDDSFFYLIIGRHLCDLGRFTFDGQQETYGFQPLYQLVIAGLAAVFQGRLTLLYAALVLSSALHVATGCGLFALLRRPFGAPAAWCATAFWLLNPALVVWFWNLKENSLFAVLLVGLLLALQRLAIPGSATAGSAAIATAPPRGIVLGVLVGLAVLARVNFLLLAAATAVPLALGLGVPHPARQRLRIFAVAVTCAAAVAGPWFLFAHLRFGTAMPTSGVVKLSRSQGFVRDVLGVGWLSWEHVAWAARGTIDYLDRSFRAAAGIFGPLIQGLALASGAGWLLARVRRKLARARGDESAAPLPPGAWWTLAYAAWFAVLNAFLNQLLLPPFLRYGQWYTVPEFVALGVGVGCAVGLCWRGLRSVVGAAVLAGSLVVGVLGWTAVRQLPWSARFAALDFLDWQPQPSTILLEVGLWANGHIPDDARVGVLDPGIVAYFSGKRLVALDRLVASLDYIRAGRRDPIAYVRDNGIAYVLGAGTRREGRFEFLDLPAGTYDVVWVPYPDIDMGWSDARPIHYMLVRPHDTPAPAFLGPEDFPFGAYYPDRADVADHRPARRLSVASALGGFDVDFDVLRLHLQSGAPEATGVSLHVGQDAVKHAVAGSNGWVHWDVSAWRGERARLAVTGGGSEVIDDLFPVDYSLSARDQ